MMMMIRGSTAVLASFLAASTLALSDSSAANHVVSDSAQLQRSSPSPVGAGNERLSSSKEDKFAPRFDGLRFIETLVTAHR